MLSAFVGLEFTTVALGNVALFLLIILRVAFEVWQPLTNTNTLNVVFVFNIIHNIMEGHSVHLYGGIKWLASSVALDNQAKSRSQTGVIKLIPVCISRY